MGNGSTNPLPVSQQENLNCRPFHFQLDALHGAGAYAAFLRDSEASEPLAPAP